MNEVQSLAAELGVTERSVRRYVALGLVRGYHLNWGHTAFRTTERVFLRERWMELAAAREALRTLPEVRLALLYGPAAFDPSAWDHGPLRVCIELDAVVRRARSGIVKKRLELAFQRSVSVLEIPLVRSVRVRHIGLLHVLAQHRVIVDRGRRLRELRRIRVRLGRELALGPGGRGMLGPPLAAPRA